MAAQDAELRLKVSLDLAFFRQQLTGLGQAAAGYKIPVQVQFDRRSVQNELNRLGENIRRRDYRLTVQTNLDQEIKKARDLARALSAVSGGGGGAIPRQGGTFRQELGSVGDINTLRSIYKEAAKKGLLAFDEEVNANKSKIITALNQAAQDASQGFLDAFSKENSRVRKAAGDYGQVLLAGLKKTLKISSPSWEMHKLGEYAADGFQEGLIKGLNEAQSSAVARMQALLHALGKEVGKFGPALMMASGGINQKNVGQAVLMASGMAGMFRPETYGQRMLRQGRESIASRYGTPSVASYTGGQGLLRYSMGASQLALPPVGGTGRSISQQARIAQAYARSSERSASVFGEDIYRQGLRRAAGQVPMGGGRFLPPGGGGGGGGGGLFGGMGDFGRALGGANLPGAGTIRELGQEFGFAAKQVLLFGTAYKALAFITDFPAQVGNAVGQLQTFKNTLGAISPTAQEAAASNQLILDLVDRYNIPLQSARDGFTKLYASMAPAGFAGDEIRNLFTGISQAAATFGMSADKVDRVNYAFAQMASKGQVMSEELKGQLGDVLPGAMAIFAEAAGFKGPKAIQDFSAALEEGRYKGEAMVALLKNVGVVMTQEFGPGAEGAARTFQGSINRMQNSLKLLYESFEPVAVGFLNGVVVPMTQGIKQIADGMNAFMSGSRAQTAGGFTLAQELQKLKPAFDGIRANVASLMPTIQALGKVVLEIGQIFLQIAGNPFVGYLSRVYLVVLPLTIAMRALHLQALVPLIASFLRSIYALTAFTASCVKAGQATQVMGLMARTAGITLRTFFASTGVGLVLVGISALIERFMSLNQRLEETKSRAIGAAQAIRSMSSTEARAEQFKRERIVRELGALGQQPGVRRGRETVVEVSPEMAKRFEEAGIPVQTTGLTGKRFIPKASIPALQQQQEQLAGEARYAQRRSAFEEQQVIAPPPLGAIPPSEQDGETGRKLQPYDRSRLGIIEQTVQKHRQYLDGLLQEQQISRTKYDIEVASLNALNEEAVAAEKLRLSKLEIDRDNMSSADKELKKYDLQVQYEREVELISGRRNLAIKKATEDIRGPFKDALRDTNIEIEKSGTEIDNLRQGYMGLTAEQEAGFRIEELTKNLKADEYRAIQDTIEALKEKIKVQIENNRLLEQERNLAAIRSRISTAGGGLMAGFYGNAAQTYERSLIESRGNKEYARQMAELETQAMKLETVFGGIQNAIGGIGDAFASMMTEGVVAMIEGTATAQEVFSRFLKSIGDALLQAAAQMIATYISIGIARIFAGLGGGGGQSDTVSNFNAGVAAYGIAEGGYLPGGFQAFAEGGMVTAPTLGLIGEGGEPEYVIPQSKMRGAMERYASGTRGASVIPGMADGSTGGDALAQMMGPIDVRYQVERINSVDYVTNDQFQTGMRQAALQGAVQGEQRTLRRLQMSTSTRKRVGL